MSILTRHFHGLPCPCCLNPLGRDVVDGMTMCEWCEAVIERNAAGHLRQLEELDSTAIDPIYASITNERQAIFRKLRRALWANRLHRVVISFLLLGSLGYIALELMASPPNPVPWYADALIAVLAILAIW